MAMIYEPAELYGQEEVIRLPEPRHEGVVSLEQALSLRRSVRSYRDGPLDMAEVSQLLWAAQGLSGRGGYRNAPSAGALYPLELYLVAGDVKGLAAGVYKYRPQKHDLVKAAKGDSRSELCDAALGQTSIKRAAAVLVMSAVYERTTVKYGERGVRYVHMEAGHAAQNVYLQAVPLRIGTVVIGAFRDDAVKKVIGMPGNEHPLYIMPVGKIK
ncbi:MAG: SagB/ThcOx family dehydrogenase [Nitrospirae bacterium]|nr:MAG: SagB/ThcOx family dehydrogenase [Nitrospirota bacterium]